MFMVSGWWLLVAFWIGGCLGLVLATVLHMARYNDELAERARSAAQELPFGGEQAAPDA